MVYKAGFDEHEILQFAGNHILKDVALVTLLGFHFFSQISVKRFGVKSNKKIRKEAQGLKETQGLKGAQGLKKAENLKIAFAVADLFLKNGEHYLNTL